MAAKQTQSSLISILLALVVLVAGMYWYTQHGEEQSFTVPPGDFLFCFWNVENLFDDDDNPKDNDALEDWLANDPAALQHKLKKNAEVLLAMNGGKGPDIIALAEVENERAAEMLREELNRGLPEELHYKHAVLKEVKVGRNIAPALITRLPVIGDRTRQLGGKTKRILKAHVKAGDRELVVIAAHWTSRVRRPDGTDGEDQRIGYAQDIYGEVKGMILSNPSVDVLICGDFNDDPDDVSVTEHLKAIGDPEQVRAAGNDPYLFNLMAGKDPKTFGTLYHGKWHIFDQIVVSPGMLESEGWSCDPQSVQTIKKLNRPGSSELISLINPRGKLGQPWPFGREKDYGGNLEERGYSDHFPVTVTLSAKGKQEE